MKKEFSFRKLINDLHLWAGLASGLILFVVCLSGTVLVFRHDIEMALESDKYHFTIPENGKKLSADALIVEVEKATQKGEITAITVNKAADKPYEVTIKSSPEERRGTTYLVNPYTGEVLGDNGSRASEFFMVMFRLHRWLLLDTEIGRPIVGGATLIFLGLLLSGMVLWLPKKWKNWKQGLKIKTNGNWKRLNHDLHNALGFYTFPLLLIMAVTGLCWSFEWWREGLGNMIGADVFGGRGRGEELLSNNENGEAALDIEEALAIAQTQFADADKFRISLPNKPEATYSIRAYQTGFSTLSIPDNLQLDQYSGEILKLEKFADKPFGQKLAASIHDAHMGEIFGTFSKILYFIACLIATSLPVTGTIIWLNKLKKKRKRLSVKA